MIENIKKGITVFAFRSIHDPVEEGIIEDPTIREIALGQTTYRSISSVDWKYYIEDDNGTRSETPDFGGSGCCLENTFLTAKEAFEAKKKLVEEHCEKLKSEITDVESLLKFPLNHCLNGDEYTNWYAREVYEEYIEKYKKGELK